MTTAATTPNEKGFEEQLQNVFSNLESAADHDLNLGGLENFFTQFIESFLAIFGLDLDSLRPQSEESPEDVLSSAEQALELAGDEPKAAEDVPVRDLQDIFPEDAMVMVYEDGGYVETGVSVTEMFEASDHESYDIIEVLDDDGARAAYYVTFDGSENGFYVAAGDMIEADAELVSGMAPLSPIPEPVPDVAPGVQNDQNGQDPTIQRMMGQDGPLPGMSSTIA